MPADRCDQCDLPVLGLPQVPPGEDPQMVRVRELATDGQKIEAITLTRDVTGWSRKEARNFVDRL